MQSDWYGGGTIQARVASLTDTSAWAKAGVMFRASLAANAPHVMIVVSPGKGIAMQYRSAAGGTSAQVAQVPGVAPTYLRLTRAADVFTGEWSSDLLTWHAVGTATVALPPGALIGMALTSHNTSASTAASFELADPYR